MTQLVWYSTLDYGVDRIMLFATQMSTQSYPWAYHCYFAVDEAVTQAFNPIYFDQMWDRLLIDAIFEMREHVDAARKVYKVATDISA